MMAIQDEVHLLLPEREAVFANKLTLFAEGCRVLVADDGTAIGYALSHPWMVDDAPRLDTAIERLPDTPDCLFIHDVALVSAARGRGAGRLFVGLARAVAARRKLPSLALVSVYGTGPFWQSCGFSPRTGPDIARKLAPYGPTATYMTAPVQAGDPAERRAHRG